MLLAVNIISGTILREESISVFDKWKSRLCKCIDRGREDLEINSLLCLYHIPSGDLSRANGLEARPG
jgi:hypothetical protein